MLRKFFLSFALLSALTTAPCASPQNQQAPVIPQNEPVDLGTTINHTVYGCIGNYTWLEPATGVRVYVGLPCPNRRTPNLSGRDLRVQFNNLKKRIQGANTPSGRMSGTYNL